MPNQLHLHSSNDLDIVCKASEVHPVEVDTDMLVKAGWTEYNELNEFHQPTNVYNYSKRCGNTRIVYRCGILNLYGIDRCEMLSKGIDQVHIMQQMLMIYGLDEVAVGLEVAYGVSMPF